MVSSWHDYTYCIIKEIGLLAFQHLLSRLMSNGWYGTLPGVYIGVGRLPIIKLYSFYAHATLSNIIAFLLFPHIY